MYLTLSAVEELAVELVTQQACAKTVELMAGEPTLASRGFWKFAWLKVLKISVRNVALTRSVI